MKFRKKGQAGEEEKEQRSILGQYMIKPRAAEIFDAACVKFPRVDVGKDKILDALAAVVTAYKIRGRPQTLPKSLPTDPQYPRLRMEMFYRPSVIARKESRMSWGSCTREIVAPSFDSFSWVIQPTV